MRRRSETYIHGNRRGRPATLSRPREVLPSGGLSSTSRIALHAGLLVLTIWLSRLALTSIETAPWVWVALAWLALGVTEIALCRHELAKIAWLSVVALVLTLMVYEIWLQVSLPPGVEQQTHPYITGHPVYGYGPVKDIRVASSLHFGGELAYEAVYTFDGDGLRWTPQEAHGDGPGRECILFFGDSFTFGEGLSDEQTLPAQLAAITGGHWYMRNFGFRGYGPHHMLAAFEAGIVDGAARCRPKHVIFQTAIWHARRVIGATTWNKNGPRYVMADGKVTRSGRFSDFESQRWRRVMDALERSLVFESTVSSLLDHRKRDADQEDVDLMVAIIARSRDLSAKVYPEAAFHVLLWDMEPHEQLAHLQRSLAVHGLNFHSVRKMLTAGGNDPFDRSYYVHPKDRHPSAKAFAAIATYVAREILSEKERE